MSAATHPPPAHVALWLARLHRVEAEALVDPYAYPARALTDAERALDHASAALEAEALAERLADVRTDEQREALRDAAWQSWIGGAP